MRTHGHYPDSGNFPPVLRAVMHLPLAEHTLGQTGFRFGAGGGAMYMLVRRVTTGTFIAVPGVDGAVRFGYDAGLPGRPFVLADFEVRLPLGAVAWGPTVQAGWRF